MTYSHHIPLFQADGELVPSDAFSRVVQSSAKTSWKHVVVEQHQISSNEWANLMYKQHVIVVNVGPGVNCEYKKSGRFRKVLKLTGAVSFFPSFQPFFLRVKMDVLSVKQRMKLALLIKVI